MKTYDYGDRESSTVLIQMVGDHDMAGIENEVRLIRELSGTDDFRLIAVKVDNWNDDLSPWEAPAVFGQDGFGGGAERTLQFLKDEVIAPIVLHDKDVKFYIGGYSLAGLFAIWSIYQIDIFAGCVAASPSAWFPKFTDYISSRKILTEKVYLSLGDKEEKTRNPVMSQVGNAIREIHGILNNEIETVLEWNQGNHFKEPDLRTAKGFAWVI